jgi:hypothetical protein
VDQVEKPVRVDGMAYVGSDHDQVVAIAVVPD